MSTTSKLGLFLSSYAPLFVIFGLRLAPSAASYILWGVACLGVLFAVALFSIIAPRLSPHQVDATDVQSREEVIAFVVTYVIPFLSFNEQSWQDWAATSLLLLVVAILYVNSPLVYTNPVLAILGWHTYELRTTSGVRMLVTKRRHAHGPQSLNVIALGDNVLLEAK